MPTQTTTNNGQCRTPLAALEDAFRAAISQVLGDSETTFDPVIRASQKAGFGDFQCNAAMALAKTRGLKPRDLAESIVAAVDLGGLAGPLEIAGPGFINITLNASVLNEGLRAMDDVALGIPMTGTGHAIAVDLCGVNVAKQMHVGHLRSTIIGDAIARLHERTGWNVHRENHLGDWGLPIAMTLTALHEESCDLASIELPALNHAYKNAQLAGRGDARGLAAAHENHCGPHRIAELEVQTASAADAIAAAKETLIRLQSGDPELVRDWHAIIDCTMHEVFDTLEMLNVLIGPENNRGESFYKDKLSEVVEAFLAAGLAEEDNGAIIVRFEGRERPLLIRKSDGGFLYATTDLAAVRHRAQTLGAERIVYVVDARQRDHFRDVFDAVQLINWNHTPDGHETSLFHLPFGAVLGKDKRPLKTRSGENFTLRALLEEAIERGTAEVRVRAADERAPTHGESEEVLRTIGRAVGIAAVKYADLSSGVTRDYVFDLDRMIAFEGDTGPYIQYAHARICSILSRANDDNIAYKNAAFQIEAPQEKKLALALLAYGKTVNETAQHLEPHRLCGYLSELATEYSAFYQSCPVLKNDDNAVRASRLRLCALTRSVIADGLALLGIETPHRM